MATNIPLVLNAVLDEYELPLNGHHGVAHWARVLENGMRLEPYQAEDLLCIFKDEFAGVGAKVKGCGETE